MHDHQHIPAQFKEATEQEGVFRVVRCCISCRVKLDAYELI